MINGICFNFPKFASQGSKDCTCWTWRFGSFYVSCTEERTYLILISHSSSPAIHPNRSIPHNPSLPDAPIIPYRPKSLLIRTFDYFRVQNSSNRSSHFPGFQTRTILLPGWLPIFKPKFWNQTSVNTSLRPSHRAEH